MSSDSNDSSPEDRPLLSIASRRRRNNRYDDLVEDVSASDFTGLEIFSWEDDDLALRSAAAQARLHYDRLSAEELLYFPDILENRATKNLYLYLRNKCLQLWNLGPQVQLSYEAFFQQIKSPFNSDPRLVLRIHAFLERHCYINNGLFHLSLTRKLNNPKKIIVIGAGLSGLIAAIQLKFFDYDVVLLEGRGRTGGRVMTHTFPAIDERTLRATGDLGAMVVMGVVGNPIRTLIQQKPIMLQAFNIDTQLFTEKGDKVSAEKDKNITDAHDLLLDTCVYISKELGVNEISGKRLSVGRALDLLVNQMELRVTQRRLKFWQAMLKLGQRRQRIIKDVFLLGKEVNRLTELLETAIANGEGKLLDMDFSKLPDDNDVVERALELRIMRRDLKVACEKFETLSMENHKIALHYKELLRIEPCQVYMNAEDRKVDDYHRANLEYALGCSLNKVSLKHWDFDDDFEFEGSHMMVKGGFHKITNFLTERVRDMLHLGTVVHDIEYNTSGVKVTALCDKGEVSFAADAVVCTLPLGVLKRMYTKLDPQSEPPNWRRLKFSPDLPKHKKSAIQRMGFGSLNKAVLHFPAIFWDDTIISKISNTPEAKGECFQFYSPPNEPVLIGLLAGTSANVPDGRQYEQLLKVRICDFLRATFPGYVDPIDFVITRWHTDRFTRGCYTYISVDATVDDLDTLAEPVCDTEGVPRVFFAGEHTSRQYSSTTHGALISGMREATRVADTFEGPLPIYRTNRKNVPAKTESKLVFGTSTTKNSSSAATVVGISVKKTTAASSLSKENQSASRDEEAAASSSQAPVETIDD